VKATLDTLLNSTQCPSGTEPNPVPCFVPVAQLVNIVSLNASSGLFSPSMGVDQRGSGTGAGDVYVAVAQNNADGTRTSISLSACTNALSRCSGEVTISGSDTDTGNPWVQVRQDGGITVSYVQREAETPTSALDIRFVNCQPAGAPHAPVCTPPIPVIRETQPAGIPGMVQLTPQFVNPISIQTTDPTYPKHVNRLESDGSMTTFLIYDRCDTTPVTGNEYFFPLCPKTDIAMLTSIDGGTTWSPIEKVSTAAGQQFFGNMALDGSTGTVNVAYYSTEGDAQQTSMQVFLAQVPPGQTSAGIPLRITANFYDGPLGGFNGNAGLPGSYLGIAAASGHVYIHFTGSVVQGNYGGVPFPATNNILTRFLY
jgi:hypothetical protein